MKLPFDKAQCWFEKTLLSFINPNMVIGLEMAIEVTQTMASLMTTTDLEMFLVVRGERIAM